MSQPTPTGPSAYGPPPQGPGQPMAPYGQPTPPPVARKSWFAQHKILTGLGAVVVLIVVIAIAGGGGGDDGTTPGTAATQQAPATDDGAAQAPAEDVAPAEPGLNEPAADGTFSFVVTGVETGVAQVGGEYLTSQAQGQYTLVHLTVTNTGSEPQYMFASSQEATDAQGRTFSVDSTATIYAGETDAWASEINPGNQITGTLVFDIPADATLSTVTLHDSPFSGGVTVRLG
ncbi:DUF4352 domain-containing protein [Cellulomonas sp. RIT-PI-Y]|uniref:DUF4352 domain-containing protein n=1 Tax=Cellulomonas sp. RIT-PI-Y TaxID=3035297 RepID=UPI0021D9E642|nr:DUF4352 domain-containing protein [Cellulomonas sp. RIT-PI-Y]